MSELSDRLRRLASRGEPRGAADVFTAAQAQAQADLGAPERRTRVITRPERKVFVATAIAAAVTLVGGVTAALTLGNGASSPKPTNTAIKHTPTRAPAATTSTTMSEATRVYLASTRLVPFDACPALASYAKTQALKDVGPYGLPGGNGGGYTTPLAAGASAGTEKSPAAANDSASSPPAAPSEASTPAHSDTNVQEAGIDEPDSVKTDGKTIFQVENGTVFAVSAGTTPQLIGSLQVDGASELLKIADKLIVVSPGGGVYATTARSSSAGMAPYGGGTLQSRFTVVDVSDPKHMTVTGHLDVDGAYVDARTVDGVARIVIRSNPTINFAYPQDGTPQAQAAAKRQNVDIIRGTSTDTWLPHYTATDARGHVQQGKAFACDASYHPPQFSGFGMLSVLSFNTDNPSYTRAASVMGDGEIVYASPTRVYVATNAWGNVVPAGTPSAVPPVPPSPTTLIHAFDISDPVQAVYRESGRVTGTILNSYAMSEYQGALRVASTDTGNTAQSYVTVLGDSGNALVPVGQVGGLGKGERIYAVRFIGPVGYVVTFRQFDPLYVVDLSDVDHPKVVGSLEVSGYSAYLHPVSDGMLLAVGAEIVNGEPSGIQMSLYDVHDPANPKMLARKDFGQGFSGAAGNFDPHAFLYWPATQLAVVPLTTYGGFGQSSDPSQNFNGAIGMHVSSSSIDEVGRAQAPNSQYGQPGIERSVVIGDRLYLTTSQGLLVVRLDNLQQIAWVSYPQPQPQNSPPGQPQPQPQP